MEKNRTNSFWLGNRPYPQGLLHPVQVLSNPISPGVNTFSNPSLSLSFGLHHEACRILLPWPGIEPAPPAVEAQSLNHWKAREVPTSPSLWFDFLARDLACLHPLYDASSPTWLEQVVNGKWRIQDLLHDTDSTSIRLGSVSGGWTGNPGATPCLAESMHTDCPAVRHGGRTAGSSWGEEVCLRISDKGMGIRLPLCCIE